MPQQENAALPSQVFEWTKIPVEPTRTGARRQFFRSHTGTLDEMTLHVTTLNPGEKAHEPHKHLEEEMIICKEGTLEALINGNTQPMSAGSVLFLAPNDFHGVRNIGDTQATYYVVKWFPPGLRP